MVKIILLMLLTLGFMSQAIGDEEENFTAKSLEKLLKSGEAQKRSASERLKASSIDRNSLQLLREDKFNYRLPNGDYVQGILLPNDRLAPAVKTKTGLKPACVTTRFTLVEGRWDSESQKIACSVPTEDLAIIDVDNVQQVSMISGKPRATKYANTDEHVSSENGQKRDSENNAEEGALHQPSNVEEQKIASQSSKYSSTSTAQRTGPVAKSREMVNKDIYVPPPRNSSTTSSTAGAIIFDKHNYGIKMGTWMKAELLRPASSAESGQIEFRLLAPIEGRYKSLPAGTELFANKSFNEANRRLEALTTTAITPDGDEIKGVSAYLYSLDQTAGIVGTIIRDREGETIAAGAGTLLATAADTLPGSGNIAANAAANFSQELLDNERQAAPQRPKAIIQVVPQVVWLKVSKSF